MKIELNSLPATAHWYTPLLKRYGPMSGDFGLSAFYAQRYKDVNNNLIKAQEISDEAKKELITAQEELHLAKNI